MRINGRWGEVKTGPYYCSNCGAGLPGLTGLFQFAGKVSPGAGACGNCHTTHMNGGLVFPTSGSHVGKDGRRTGKFHRGPGEVYKIGGGNEISD